ncbi:hypothetical protein ABZS66_29525 [Dactylosporangium sp. NPDC005572]|uniref:hypothetical protein n=1 Tax=Dactylosporangium sp. NPDC005572 TaxID=3156889 RepID=UPI0033A6F48D
MLGRQLRRALAYSSVAGVSAVAAAVLGPAGPATAAVCYAVTGVTTTVYVGDYPSPAIAFPLYNSVVSTYYNAKPTSVAYKVSTSSLQGYGTLYVYIYNNGGSTAYLDGWVTFAYAC